MADLTAPPPLLAPREDSPAPGAPAGGARRGPGYAWPTPPLACYPAPAPLNQPEPCEVEGLGGQVLTGRLLAFDPGADIVQVQVLPARTLMPMRLSMFRRLTLLRPLPTLPAAAGAAAAMLDEHRMPLPYLVRLKGGEAIEGVTVGAAEAPEGHFLFEPADEHGAVRRVFVPRAAVASIELGPRIGAALVEQDTLTPAQLDEALAEQESLRSRKLGDILVMRHIISPEELDAALDQQSRMPMVRIGEALRALGFIDEAELEAALAQQRVDRNTPLGELLVKKGVITREDLQTALARKMGYPLIDPAMFPVEAEAVARVPLPVARRLVALPLVLRGGRLVVALEDPTRRAAVDELEFAAQGKVVPVLARNGTLGGAIEAAYQRLGAVELPGLTLRGEGGGGDGPAFEADAASKLLASLEQHGGSAGTGDEDEAAGAIEQSDNSLVRLLNQMILEAQAQGVSDIHVETQPGREKVRIRFRKDGQMRPYLELPHTYRNALIARLKIMCDLDISERRKPQDGKISFGKFVQGSRLELRVATIPTFANLEDAVLRLLASAKPIPLDNLGVAPRNLERLKTAIARPYGMILCVGPTGSGKTTTLHSALGYINTPDRKIWTAEDPIEITQTGLRQVQVNPKIDWTFAKALRAFLRADPDVIMVGEIRDGETGRIAIEASLTGHLVLSTLHTNSAVETVTRLLDMGMDPFNFADALLAVLAQRLVRRLCTHCRVPHEAGPEEVEELLQDHLHAYGGAPGTPGAEETLAEWRQRFGGAEGGRLTIYKAVGCAHCDGTGYRGRAGVHELLTVTRSMRHLIQTGTRADDLQRTALAEGLRTLRQDGIEKVLAGITTIEEVRATT
jgi:type II secretory ATPase GspE/PulE/Tfp pilus assembly ATPase PilB-like protein